jgi:hypothetical protein
MTTLHCVGFVAIGFWRTADQDKFPHSLFTELPVGQGRIAGFAGIKEQFFQDDGEEIFVQPQTS